MELLVAISIVVHAYVLVKCAQFFVVGAEKRDIDKHLVASFAAGALFFFVISVANVLYLRRLEDVGLQGLLALWSGFVVFNASIHLAIVSLFLKRVNCRNQGAPRGVG